MVQNALSSVDEGRLRKKIEELTI